MTNKTERITYSEMLDSISSAMMLALKTKEQLDALTDIFLKFFEAYKEHSQFLTESVLKSELDIMGATKKTPWKRLDELEQTLKGFISYYYEDKAKSKTKRKYKQYA